jgi:hypothetical protein
MPAGAGGALDNYALGETSGHHVEKFVLQRAKYLRYP